MNIELEVRNEISKNIKNDTKFKDKEEVSQVIKNIILVKTFIALI